MRRKILLRTVVTTILLASAVAAVPEPAEAAFPGQNGRIAFSAYAGSTSSEIYTMRSNGADLKRITENSWSDYHPTYAGDGRVLAFDSYRPRQQVYIKNAGGTEGATRLTGPKGTSSFPTVSPDGTKIAFSVRSDDSYYDIWVMNADGTGKTNLTNSPGRIEDGPSWSPDGTRIAFSGTPGVDSTPPEIYVMNADGTDVKRLTKNTAPDSAPDWSPDGTRLAFERYLGFDQGGAEIHTVSATGIDEERLTFGAAEDKAPVWSPDGEKIAFASDDDIWTMNADGTEKISVTRSPRVFESYPDWQPLQRSVVP